MKKILVTGGTGYIGSHTCVELLMRGYDVVVVDNLVNSKKKTIDKIRQIVEMNAKLSPKSQKIGSLEFIECNLCNEKALEHVFRTHKFEAVIHFAGLKSVTESASQPVLYYKNNIGGTLNLIEQMLASDVRKIIFSSSAAVYGHPHKLPVLENFPLSSSTPYGTTKLYLERILTDIASANPKFSVVLLRYANPIGIHESGLIKEDPHGIPSNLAPCIAQVAVGLRPELIIYGNDYKTADGTAVRDYIHVVDLALGHIAALEKIKDAGVHIFNLGTGRGTSVLELLRAFEKSCGKSISYKIAARRELEVGECYVSCDKAKRMLDWVATKSIDEAVESIMKHINQKTR